MNKLTKLQQFIVKKYTIIAKKNNVHPNRNMMKRVGISRDQIRHHFGSLTELRKIAKLVNPSAFEGVIDEEIFTPKHLSRIKKEVRDKKTFFITTVVTGCKVNTGFLKNIDTFCEKNNAIPLFLLASDPAATANGWPIDPILKDRYIVVEDISLNSNIFISTIKLSAKHIDPITSLGRIGQREGSFVYASPKQRLKMVPTSNSKMPHAIMTTGAVTVPDYHTTRYMSERTAYIATADHVMGGIIVEIVDNKNFHFRQVQAEKNGSFIDLGDYYKNGKISKIKAEAFVMGDYHCGETEPTAESAWLEILNTVGAKNLVFHDIFNGSSISHHDQHKKILKAKRAIAHETNLEQEIKYVVDTLNLYSPYGKCIITKSNHDEFLDRYLQEGRYLDDAENHLTALELATAMVKGNDPLKYAVEKLGLKDAKNVVWLSRDQDLKIARIELGSHGDKGSNGSRGNLRSMENAYGNSVSGHSHSPEILRGAWQVGTSSFLKLDYNQGPSSWMHTSCLVYPNGSRQLINSINGQWRLKKDN